MSKLYFRAGEAEGFTSKKLADKKVGYANPIRELLQNSLDASKEAKNTKCQVSIYIENINISDVPNIKEYRATLKQAIEYHTNEKSYGSNAEQTVNFINKALDKDNLDVLMFVDNGIGMQPKILNGLIGERSIKQDESSGGSFGVGHLSSYFLSSLRYVLYASKYKDTGSNNIKTLFSGSPILAGHEDSKGIPRGSIGRILEQTPSDELKPIYTFPKQFPHFMQEKMDVVASTGSMVAILGLNNEWNTEADYAIVSNFFYAINQDALIVDINRKGGIPIPIKKTDIDNLLKIRQDGKRAHGDNILSGQAVYQSWLTVKDNGCKQEIVLKNSDKVCVHIKNNIDSSVVALVRNGMLIARHDTMLSTDINNLRKNEDFEPFSIVINADEQGCPELFKLIKGAENPYHNRLERNRLIPEDEKKLKELLKELSEKIQTQHLKKKDRKSFNLSIPLLEIPDKAETKGINTNRPRSQTAKAKPTASKPKPPINKIRETNNGKKRQAPVIVSRALESTNAVRFIDNGDTFTVYLQVTPQKIKARDDVYLSISLAQDSDKKEVETGLDFVNLSIDDKDMPITDFIEFTKNGVIQKEENDKSQFKLGKLLKEQIYNIVATIEKPKKVTGIGVALRPFLGLKQGKIIDD